MWELIWFLAFVSVSAYLAILYFGGAIDKEKEKVAFGSLITSIKDRIQRLRGK